jgi:CRISPR/Cas system-associated exonuclease Cas4 (RecB family)
MTKFLQQAADYLFSHHKDDLVNTGVVLPNRRAGLFLKQYLSQLTDRPIFSPEIFSIEDFVFRLSGYRKIEPAYLTLEFYQVYCKLEGDNARPFKEFVKWAEVVIQDFNEVDLYLVDPEELFGFLSDTKAIALWNPNGTPLTDFQVRYLEFFRSLTTLYKNLKLHLLDQGLAYQGLAYRQLAEKLERGLPEFPWKHLVFIGFNALTTSEEKILKALRDRNTATLLWDADSYYLDNPVQEAGEFLRENKKAFGFSALDWTNDYFKSGAKTIHLIGVPKNIGQARVAGQLLSELQDTDSDLHECSIVLNDENLLFPVLNSLPASVKTFNLTMGLPLRKTILHGLIDDLIRMNENALKFDKTSGESLKFYFKDIIRVLEHPYFLKLAGNNSDGLRQAKHQIRSRNQVFYSQADVTGLFGAGGPEIIRHTGEVFVPWNDSAISAVEGIRSLLKELKQAFAADEQDSDKINTEYIFHFSMLFNKLKSVFEAYPFLADLDSFRHVFMQMLRSVTIPFYGEPLQGVQIMGMLETRTLDFRNIIMLSVNEDFLPGKGISNSFIPFDLKLSFKLPTHQDRNAVSAYHFYRLLQRAEKVYLLYNTEPGDLGGGDRSRFIMQLEHELVRYNPKIELKTEVLSLVPGDQPADKEVKIPKSPDILEAIHQHARGGLSASALNAYRNCTLRYYFKYVLGIDKAEDVEEVMEASTLGNVVHDTLLDLYLPLKGRVLKQGDHKKLLSATDMALQKAFRKNYQQGDLGSGKNLLITKVAESYVQRFLKEEAKWVEEAAQFKEELIIKGIEQEMRTELVSAVTQEKVVALRGTLDRIDRFRGKNRIIDYKTGKVEPAELKLKSWEDLNVPGKGDKLFQLLFYAYLYISNAGEVTEIQAGIYSFRNLAKGFLEASLPDGASVTGSMDDFERYLKELLHGLFDAGKPFEQVDDPAVCTYCAYASICQRSV